MTRETVSCVWAMTSGTGRTARLTKLRSEIPILCLGAISYTLLWMKIVVQLKPKSKLYKKAKEMQVYQNNHNYLQATEP